MEIVKGKGYLIKSSVLILILAQLILAKYSLLIFRSEGADFEETVSGLVFDLQYDFDINQVIIGRESSRADIARAMDRHNPNVVVLMNNIPIGLYAEYQKTAPESMKKIPSVALMAILVEDVIKDINNTTAIQFEIPIVTSAIGLRSTLGKSVSRVGVIHRETHSGFIKDNREFLSREGIELIAEEVASGNRLVNDTRAALRRLVRRSNVDAIWIPVDNGLLVPTLQSVWIPELQRSSLPIIVGTRNLVKPDMPLGNFAVLPDYVALGSQAASIVFDIMDNEWEVFFDGMSQPPLSVRTFLYVPDAVRHFGLKKESITTVDIFLE